MDPAGLPFAGNQIPMSRMPAAVQKILPLWPESDRAGHAEQLLCGRPVHARPQHRGHEVQLECDARS